MRGLKVLLRTGAMGVALAGIVLASAGLSSASAQASDRSTGGAVPEATARQRQAADDYAKLPVSFVENQGQTDARVRYLAQGNGYSFFMTPSEVMLSFTKGTDTQQTPQALALALRFIGANPKVDPQGLERAPGVINDLRGTDPSMWHTDIAQYRDVVYPDLWPKIDLRLREQSGVLKYEFHVHPGATPSDIQLAYDGADGLALGKTGGLQIATPLGMLADSVPMSYQNIGGVRVPVTSRYVVDDNANANGRFSFDIGRYQRNRELIIDPGVQYTTFLGGNSAETGAGIAVNAAGNAYVAGTTQSPDFPTTTGAFDRTGAPQNFADVFVTKLNPAGTALVYSTFVGGSDMEFGRRLVIDAAGNAYVTGETKSSNFPTTGGAFDRTLAIPPNCPRCARRTTPTTSSSS